jgi:hypothetical protein
VWRTHHPRTSLARETASSCVGVLWSLYAVPMTLLLVGGAGQSISRLGTIAVIDTLVSIPSVVALYLHIFDKRFLPSEVWRVYAFAFVARELVFNFGYDPASRVAPQLVLVGLLLQIPLLVALFQHAFRRWPLVDA